MAIFLLPAIFAQTVKVTSARLSITNDRTRLVFDLSKKTTHEIKSLEKRITIAMRQAGLSADLGRLKLTQTPIVSLGHKYRGDFLEIIVVLKHPMKIRHFLLSNPERLVIDISPLEAPKYNNGIYKIGNPYTETMEAIDRVERSLIDKIYEKNITIVIDPGHGGKDCGAIGVGGIYEKQIVLAIAYKLQQIINNTPGFRAILTRSGDYFISLRKRLGIARRNNADMFISIHADAYKRKEARGVSVFVLSQKGATSEAARWLAEKENISELGQALVDKNRLLKSVLLDLYQTATINISLDMGAEIIQSISKIAMLHSSRVEQAGFVVLKSPHIPSILVEIGFLSNSIEAKLLTQDFYQDNIAQGLAAGISSYFSSGKNRG